MWIRFLSFYPYLIHIKAYGILLLILDTVFFQSLKFKVFGNTLQVGDELHQTFLVNALGVTLIPGEYRLVKSFYQKTNRFMKYLLLYHFG